MTAVLVGIYVVLHHGHEALALLVEMVSPARSMRWSSASSSAHRLRLMSHMAEQVTFVMVPPLLLIFLVLGTIFIGLATPTEGGAMGAFGASILAAAKRVDASDRSTGSWSGKRWKPRRSSPPS